MKLNNNETPKTNKQTRLNYEKSGFSSLIKKTVRKINKVEEGSYKEQFIKIHKRWGQSEYLVALKNTAPNWSYAKYLKGVDLKFDQDIPSELIEISKTVREDWSVDGVKRPVLIAASTHEIEEEIVLEAYKKVIKQYPNTLLILVPRHLERFEKVKNIVKNSGLQFASRSKKTNITNNTRHGTHSGSSRPASTHTHTHSHTHTHTHDFAVM